MRPKIDLFVEFKKIFKILSRREKTLFKFFLVVQILLGFLDLLGIMVIGIVAAISTSYVSSSPLGDRVERFLSLIYIDGLTFKSQVIALGICAAVLLGLKSFVTLALTKKSIYFLSRRSAIISSTLIEDLFGKTLTDIQKYSKQQNIYALTSGVDLVVIHIVGAFITLVADSALLIIIITGLFAIDKSMAVFSIIIFSAVGFLLYYILKVRVKALGQKQSELSIKVNEMIYESIDLFRELFVKNKKFPFSNSLHNVRMQLANSIAETSFLIKASKYWIEILTVVSGLTVCAYQFSTQSLSYAITTISIFVAASSRIGPAVLRIQQGALLIKSKIGAAEYTLNLIENSSKNSEQKPKNLNIKTNHRNFQSNILFKQVNFKFDGSSDFHIKNLNFEISSGEFVAIVGPSGSGKSTILDLMLGILEPQSGSVTISGELPKVAINKWEGAIGYVPQKTGIINGTLSDNILLAYPRSAKNNKLLNESIKAADLQHFVSLDRSGSNIIIADGGSNLSGGQKQKIGIARALVSKPKLIIFDEATSSLDAESEFNISKSILKMKNQHTIVAVAHRLSTVAKADKVIYIDNGEILKIGTFEQVRRSIKKFDKQANLMGLYD